MQISINAFRLLERLESFGDIGRDQNGCLTRLSASLADKAARDQLIAWVHDAGLRVVIDEVGNIFGIWDVPDDEGEVLLIGSYIDTVVDAGTLDGSYGVVAALEVIDALRRGNFSPRRSIALVAFSNEECVRYPSECMGSLIFSGHRSAAKALACKGSDNSIFGEELEKIGYRGSHRVGRQVRMSSSTSSKARYWITKASISGR